MALSPSDNTRPRKKTWCDYLTCDFRRLHTRDSSVKNLDEEGDFHRDIETGRGVNPKKTPLQKLKF